MLYLPLSANPKKPTIYPSSALNHESREKNFVNLKVMIVIIINGI